MADNTLIFTQTYFPDPTTGRPVALGDVFIGIPGLDPEIEANRVTVNLKEEDGTLVPVPPASQPLTLSAGGIVLFNGSPVQVLIDGDYSIKVLDSLGGQVYFLSDVRDELTELRTDIENNTTIIESINKSKNDFRLTLTSNTPVTTSDVSAASTIFMTSYVGNSISLYSGTEWNLFELGELSVPASTTASKVFDIFCDFNSGTPQLVTTDWTNDTTRATDLTTQDGVLVQTGNLGFRYLGTARTKIASQVDDSLAFRYLWNYYHRVKRPMLVEESTDTWTYTTPIMRQANGSAANELDFVIGVQEDTVEASLIVSYTNTNLVIATAGIGLDSTTTIQGIQSLMALQVVDRIVSISAEYSEIVAEGRHFLSWNERSVATGTTTWQGDGGAPLIHQSGIQGSIWA